MLAVRNQAPSPSRSNGSNPRGSIASTTSASTSHHSLGPRISPLGTDTDTDAVQGASTVLFGSSKGEICTPTSGFKGLQRRLRASFRVAMLKDAITESKLAGVALLVFGAPRDKFSSAEFAALKTYLDTGGSVLYLAAEGGESQLGTNFNYLLEEYGVVVNSDTVIRSVYYKYHHPKEVLIANGVLNRELNRAAGKRVGSAALDRDDAVCHDKENPSSLTFVYPFGATLTVQTPSVPILSSSPVSYPVNRPIGSAYVGAQGKLVVVGSAHLFSDEYIDKEENAKLFDVLLRFLTTDRIQLNPIDASEPEISDYHYTPDIGVLAASLRVCLHESDDVPKDFTALFDHGLFKFDLELVPAALGTYAALGLVHEPLRLIPPEFDAPLPPLHLALHPPDLRALPHPALELFDVDEVFASPRARLARLANKCDDGDLEYFVREAGHIVGASQRVLKRRGVDNDAKSIEAKDVLEEVVRCLVHWKGAGDG
ncbi:hypothetical protein SeLEV6574_g00355 [Synchytrium endobioticum]|uniref:Uncharacterized protein n=1 Tax=Synchytrium endobioticum TaxID=286115 RepID=A0A507DIJ2_9FUNG|nr:hypothetical protein SeLEV6574_g00355 [Synchytrium endobioticum]